MAAGDWYCCLDPELEALRRTARDACHAHRTRPPGMRGAMAEELAALFAAVGEGCFVEAPFHCAYGINVSLGDGAYLNANCTILDSAPVTIGARALLGPGVQIYCADHHRDPERRAAGIERALPVAIGRNAWIGGAAILMPGVAVGADAIVGAGSVVTRDVAPGARVAGAPAREMGR